jgi:xylulokinase
MDISQEDPLQIHIRNSGFFGGIPGYYETLGLSPEKMTDVKNPSELIGTLTREAALETGLAAGTPVVAGAMDTSASALGMEIVKAGQTLHVAGQAGAIGVCLDKPLFDRRLCIHNHVVPDMWLVVGVMVATGASMRWIRDVFAGTDTARNGPGEVDAFRNLSEAAGKSPDGAGGVIFLPYLMGERTPVWDYEARGVFFGMSLKTRKEDLIRAVMEGVAFALRHNIEVLRTAGIDIDEITCAGGAIHSDLWNQIKSDVTRKTLVCVGTLPATTLGAAMLAAEGIGMKIGSFQNDAMKHDRKVFRPRAETWERYDRLFEIYKKLYTNLKDEFSRLSSITSPS